uniref:Uncharacterized protein n=1 Tax=Malurus cyaneus samueli TaxID=2593467 RepID=A0A8C5X049_9PASS
MSCTSCLFHLFTRQDLYKTQVLKSNQALLCCIPESQNPRVPKSQNPRNPKIPESQNPKLPESRNPRIIESQNPKIPESWNTKIPESQNPRIPKSQNPQIPWTPVRRCMKRWRKQNLVPDLLNAEKRVN